MPVAVGAETCVTKEEFSRIINTANFVPVFRVLNYGFSGVQISP